MEVVIVAVVRVRKVILKGLLSIVVSGTVVVARRDIDVDGGGDGLGDEVCGDKISDKDTSSFIIGGNNFEIHFREETSFCFVDNFDKLAVFENGFYNYNFVFAN